MKVCGSMATCARRQDGVRMSGEGSSEVLWRRRRPTHRRGGRRRGFGSDCSSDRREKVARRLASAQRKAVPACGGRRVSGGRWHGAAYWRGGEAGLLRNDDGGFGQELSAGEFYACSCGRRAPPTMSNQDAARPDRHNDRWAPFVSRNPI
jgi:hypothetical protein